MKLGATDVKAYLGGSLITAQKLGLAPIQGGGAPRPDVYLLSKGVGTMTLSATQAGVFVGPVRLLSYEVVSAAGGSATVYMNSVNTGTAILTGLNAVAGKQTIDKGVVAFLGLSVLITGSITIRIEYETYAAETTKEPVYAYGDDIWQTIFVTANRGGLRKQPSEIASFLCYGAGGTLATIYNNWARSGETIYSGAPAINVPVNIDPDKLARIGLSVGFTGSYSLALQVK